MKLLKWIRRRWNSVIEATTPLTPLEKLFLTELENNPVEADPPNFFFYKIGSISVYCGNTFLSVHTEDGSLGELPAKYIVLLYKKKAEQRKAEEGARTLRLLRELEAKNETT